jgi:hypothetical protein
VGLQAKQVLRSGILLHARERVLPGMYPFSSNLKSPVANPALSNQNGKTCTGVGGTAGCGAGKKECNDGQVPPPFPPITSPFNLN